MDVSETQYHQLAATMVPDERVQQYNLGLLDFAATVCTARSPNCEECFASGYYAYYEQGGPRDADG